VTVAGEAGTVKETAGATVTAEVEEVVATATEVVPEEVRAAAEDMTELLSTVVVGAMVVAEEATIALLPTVTTG
jgi:hypothetical protein